ncbi:MAG: O-antigen ligase family protein [Candidatus Korobacteraceae bacterium]
MITVMSRFMDMTTAPAEYANETDFVPSETLAPASSQATPLPSRSHSAPRDRARFFQYVLLLYLFLYCSRVSEMIPGMRFAIVLLPILLVGLLLSGRTKAILGMRSGRVLIAFTFWVAVCVPTSLWRTDSLRILRGNVIALLLVALMAAFIRTVRDSFRLMYTIGLSMGLVAIMGLVFRHGDQSRLGAEGTLSLKDPNFFCLYILVGICFLSLSVSVHKGFKRLFSLGLIVLCLGAAARSGSRMGLVAFAVAALMFFIFGNARQRIFLLIGCVLLIAVVPPMLPQNVKDRFLILFRAGQGSSREDVSAAESAVLRRRLFFDSLRFTLEHPFLGVGPGQFMQAEVQQAAEEHRKALWLYSHNAYTETSSETGIVGLVLFLVAFLGAQVGLRRIRKYGPNLLTRRMALFTHLALIIATLCAFFLTLGYSGLIWVLIGISGTFQMAVARQAKLAEPPQGKLVG